MLKSKAPQKESAEDGSTFVHFSKQSNEIIEDFQGFVAE